VVFSQHIKYRDDDGNLDADSVREFWKAKHEPATSADDEPEAEARTLRLLAAAFDVDVAAAEARALELGLISIT